MITNYINYLRLRKGYSPCTCRTYTSCLRSFALAMQGKRWSTICKDDIDGFLAQLSKLGAKPSTITAYVSAIRGFYNYLVAVYGLDVNPARYLVSPKKVKSLPHTISMDDITKAIVNEPRQDVKVAIMLLASTGMRISELRLLTWGNVYLDECSALIFGKGGKERYVYYPSVVAHALYALLGAHKGYVFVGWQDRALRYAIWQAFKRVEVECSPHVIRHTFATESIKRGMDIHTLSKILGHDNIATTQIYLHNNIQMSYNKIY